MNDERIIANAALLYYALLLPKQSRHIVIDQQLKQKFSFGEYDQLTVESVSENGKLFIDGNIEFLKNDPDPWDASEDTLLSIIDMLFNDQNDCLNRVERARLLATLQTIGTVCMDKYGCNLFTQRFQEAFSCYGQITPMPNVKFQLSGKPAWGSYVQLDSFQELNILSTREEDDSDGALSTFEGIDQKLQKLPKFWKDIQGRDNRLMREFYRLLQKDKDCPLFLSTDDSSCSEENFLALFEGIPGYEDKSPLPFRSRASLAYWGIFLSAIYDDCTNIYLANGKEINRSATDSKNSDELSVSSIATTLIWPKKGKPSTSPSTFDKGSGTLSKKQSADFEKLVCDCYQEARRITLPPSEIRKQIKK